MVSKAVVARARKSLLIDGRYDAQELVRVGGRLENIRKDWTPAQMRRMRKKHNKAAYELALKREEAAKAALQQRAAFDLPILDRAMRGRE